MLLLQGIHHAGFLIAAEICFCILLLRSERLRAWADILCCALMGAFIHFLLLQYGNLRAEEWEILSASVLVLGFALMGWNVTRLNANSLDRIQQFSTMTLAEQDQFWNKPASSMHAERLKVMGEASARFVHEIGNPLAVMALRLEEIKRARKNQDEKTIEKSIKSLESQVRHLLQISQALKNFSRTDAQIQPGFVGLSDVFELTRDLCDAWSFADGIEFSWPKSVPSIDVAGGATPHAQVLVNLIKNSIDALAELPPSTRRWLKVEIAERGGAVEISVSNAGAPLKRDVQHKLFKPFFTTKRTGHGLGLGLSICQQLVYSMGGEIWYDENSRHPRFVVRYSFLPSVHGAHDQGQGENHPPFFENVA